MSRHPLRRAARGAQRWVRTPVVGPICLLKQERRTGADDGVWRVARRGAEKDQRADNEMVTVRKLSAQQVGGST